MPLPEGSVSRETVIAVLSALADVHGFSMRVDGSMLTVVMDGVPEAFALCDPIGRRMVTRIAHKYAGGRVEYFYHPEMLAKPSPGVH